MSQSYHFRATEYKLLRNIYIDPQYRRKLPKLNTGEERKSKHESSHSMEEKESKSNKDERDNKQTGRLNLLKKLVDNPGKENEKKRNDTVDQTNKVTPRKGQINNKETKLIKSENDEKDSKKSETLENEKNDVLRTVNDLDVDDEFLRDVLADSNDKDGKNPKVKSIEKNKNVIKQVEQSEHEKKLEPTLKQTDEPKKETEKPKTLVNDKVQVSKLVKNLNENEALLGNILGEPKNKNEKNTNGSNVDNKANKIESEKPKPNENNSEKKDKKIDKKEVKQPVEDKNNNTYKNNSLATPVAKTDGTVKEDEKTNLLGQEKKDLAKKVDGLNVNKTLLDNILGKPNSKDDKQTEEKKIVEEKAENKVSGVNSNNSVKEKSEPKKETEKTLAEDKIKIAKTVNGLNVNETLLGDVLGKSNDQDDRKSDEKLVAVKGKIKPDNNKLVEKESEKNISKIVGSLGEEKRDTVNTINAQNMTNKLKDKIEKKPEDSLDSEKNKNQKAIQKKETSEVLVEEKKDIAKVTEGLNANNGILQSILDEPENSKKSDDAKNGSENQSTKKQAIEKVAEKKNATSPEKATNTNDTNNQELLNKKGKTEPASKKNNTNDLTKTDNDGEKKPLVPNENDKLEPVHKKVCLCRCCKTRTLRKLKKEAEADKNIGKESSVCTIQ